MSYFFVAGLNLGLVAMLTGGLECAWALHFMHNFFIGIIVGGPAALYHSILAASTTLYSAGSSATMYYFLLGTGYFLWRNIADFVPIITEALVKPIFEVDKIDRTVELSPQAEVSVTMGSSGTPLRWYSFSPQEQRASKFREDVLNNVVQSLGLEEHVGVKTPA